MPRTTRTKSNPRRHPRKLPQSNQPCSVGRFGCPSARARREDLGVCALGIQSSVSRKHKCLLSGVRPVASHESDEPRRSNTPGLFLGKRSPHPRQSPLIGEGGGRLASSRPAALSVPEGAIGIPLHFCADSIQVNGRFYRWRYRFVSRALGHPLVRGWECFLRRAGGTALFYVP